ncbi:MAG: hypothetical protein HW380_256 [Magnetococcales bacterium]|nr:hypothetical protein [Magnetococcales bacterium]HIJ84179.1 NYN domain-containing protein [Magnetococcales bacterium]
MQPVKVAILIDGGYFLKRIHAVRPDVFAHDPIQVDKAIGQLVHNHLSYLNKVACADHPFSLLYRCFYYDANPYANKGHLPVSHSAIDYAKSDEAVFRLKLFDLLRRRSNFALRLGEVRRERAWVLSERAQKDLLAKRRPVDSLTDADFWPGFRQKGVDIASISLKKQADTIVLVTGDSDFVPATKLARREGIRIILDPMWQSVGESLFEHIDGLFSGFGKPKAKDSDDSV